LVPLANHGSLSKLQKKAAYLDSFGRSAPIISLANFSIGMPDARDNFKASTSLPTFHSLIHRLID
jgi:hypothetical protein